MSSEPPADQGVEWLPTTCAPRRYPIEVYSGALLYGEDSGAALGDGQIVSNGWGELGAIALVGEATKPMPAELDVIWLSYAENTFYDGTFPLPFDRLADMFERGVRGPNGEPIHYDRVIVGMAPGGLVSLWLAAEATVHEVAAFQAAPLDMDWEQFTEGENVDRDAFVRDALLQTMSEAEIERLTRDGVARGLYERYRNQYVWTIQIVGEGRTPERAWVRTLNGERDLVRFDQAATRPTMAVPKQIDLQWAEAGHSYVAPVEFNSVEAMMAFEALSAEDPQQPLILLLDTTSNSAMVHVPFEQEQTSPKPIEIRAFWQTKSPL